MVRISSVAVIGNPIYADRSHLAPVQVMSDVGYIDTCMNMNISINIDKCKGLDRVTEHQRVDANCTRVQGYTKNHGK